MWDVSSCGLYVYIGQSLNSRATIITCYDYIHQKHYWDCSHVKHYFLCNQKSIVCKNNVKFIIKLGKYKLNEYNIGSKFRCDLIILTSEPWSWILSNFKGKKIMTLFLRKTLLCNFLFF